MSQRSLVPTAVRVTVTINADTEQAVRDALLASLMAMRHGIAPNSLWGHGFAVAINTGGKP
jgi:hypothetical protein